MTAREARHEMHVRRFVRRATVATRGAPRAMISARLLLLFEAATFVAAAATHAGALGEGHRHREAAIAETVIATVLIAALALGWTPRPWPLRFAVVAQGFALAGTLVGLFTIAIGVGPRTVPDVAYHFAILIVIGAGLAAALPAAAMTPRRPPKVEDAMTKRRFSSPEGAERRHTTAAHKRR